MSNKSKIYYEINKLNIVGTWKYNTLNDKCSLCHQDLMLPTNTQNNKINGYISVSKCEHGYHEDCITRWINNNNNNCPICNVLWTDDKNISTSVYVYKSI